MRAYGVRPWQFIGPDWLFQDQWDIVARVPEETSDEQINLMLQNLLSERFGLVAHKETRILPRYELTVGNRRPDLRDSKLPAASEPNRGFSIRGLPTDKDGWPVLPPEADGVFAAPSGDRTRWMFRHQTVAELVSNLQTQVQQAVVDLTGLTGIYDFDLTIVQQADLKPDSDQGARVPAAATFQRRIFDAVDALGLKLTPGKGSVEVLVVDRVNKEPTEN